jgi:hypothetical protein
VLFPLIVLLAAIYLVIAPFSKTPLPAFFCLLFILCGIPVYFLFVYKTRPACLSRLDRAFGKLKLPQKCINEIGVMFSQNKLETKLVTLF